MPAEDWTNPARPRSQPGRRQSPAHSGQSARPTARTCPVSTKGSTSLQHSMREYHSTGPAETRTDPHGPRSQQDLPGAVNSSLTQCTVPCPQPGLAQCQGKGQPVSSTAVTRPTETRTNPARPQSQPGLRQSPARAAQNPGLLPGPAQCQGKDQPVSSIAGACSTPPGLWILRPTQHSHGANRVGGSRHLTWRIVRP